MAGHRGLAGSAIVRALQSRGYSNLILRTHTELDLTDQYATRDFFAKERPDYVFLAAAKVGGILANDTFPAAFIHENLAIQTNVIHESWQSGVKRLLFLGSSCIYPRSCPQPIREEYLLTGPLERTNQAYAIAKIAGIEMCRAFNQERSTRFACAMPTNLYGPNDSYSSDNSHVIPALIKKLDEAASSSTSTVSLWGTGTPRREFLHSSDLAEACIAILQLRDDQFDEIVLGRSPLINIGSGEEVTIAELASLISEVVGFRGNLLWDHSKPDGTPRKLLDSSLIRMTGWSNKVDLRSGVLMAHKDFKLNRKFSV